MRSFFLSGGALVAALFALVTACNGRLAPEDGNCGTAGGSAFCEPTQAADDPGAFPPGPLPPFPDGCQSKTLVYPSNWPGCTTIDFGWSYPPGSVCSQAQDCASVCCVVDDNGTWHPADEPGDAGMAADASAERDADADAVDASAEAGRRENPRNVLACNCRCLTPQEACALANEPKGLGGP